MAFHKPVYYNAQKQYFPKKHTMAVCGLVIGMNHLRAIGQTSTLETLWGSFLTPTRTGTSHMENPTVTLQKIVPRFILAGGCGMMRHAMFLNAEHVS